MHAPWSSTPWRRVAVYGLGISGRAAIDLLRRHHVHVVAFDDRPGESLDVAALANDPGIELHLGEAMQEDELLRQTATLDGVVISPGIPPQRPLLCAARQHQLPVIAEVELAFALLDGEVAAITGSNGKSTTTALTGAMLAAAGRNVEVCGNIGEALSSRVEGEAGRIFVVELSSFQLEAVDRFHPASAALLNLSHDHLDRHADLDSYLAVKAAIFARQTGRDLAVLNAADRRLAELETTSHRRFFSSSCTVTDGCYLSRDTVLEVSPGSEVVGLFERRDVPLPGPHNLENAMAAALLARAHGATPRDIVTGMKTFRGLPHRLQWVREHCGVVWYDDSKGTNLAATLRSLEGFPDGRVHIILGGRSKGGDLAPLTELLSRKARRAYLIGESAADFAAAMASQVPCEITETLQGAVQRAVVEARAGDTVLLSPACSSFDQFDNFAQRGRVFQRLVRALEGGDLGS